MITVKTYSSLLDAEMDQSLLTASGIESFIIDENSGIVGCGALTGIRLQVLDTDAKQAEAILKNETVSQELPVEGDIPGPEARVTTEEKKPIWPWILFIILTLLAVAALTRFGGH